MRAVFFAAAVALAAVAGGAATTVTSNEASVDTVSVTSGESASTRLDARTFTQWLSDAFDYVSGKLGSVLLFR